MNHSLVRSVNCTLNIVNMENAVTKDCNKGCNYPNRHHDDKH